MYRLLDTSQVEFTVGSFFDHTVYVFLFRYPIGRTNGIDIVRVRWLKFIKLASDSTVELLISETFGISSHY